MPDFAEGVPCWADCALPDAAAGRRFYGALFGWTFREPPGAGESYAYVGPHPVAGLYRKPDGRLPTTWTVHFATPDARRLLDRVRAAGGTAISGPRAVGDLGVGALAADPDGAVFGLWQPGTDKGFRELTAPGSYAGSEVRTRDSAAVDPFYEHVFGYVGHDVPGPGGTRLWSPGDAAPGIDTAVLGRAVLEPGEVPAELPAHVLVRFRVEECAATAAAALGLGGSLREGPRETEYGTFAELADDQGAVFGVVAE
ncbi:VOC family protein [Streptomyces sp. SPB074]|uniref:VOC family protein n=1 Tax=Streptomyces sp. (strain SPB074) TaxID=465543 RepID=UPI00017F291C|nr:VOC family protein [Streptomyces sp. SPB074]